NGFPTTPGAFQTIYDGGGDDAFVTKLSADGSSLVRSTLFPANVTAVAIALDSAGNVYLAGSALANFPTTPGAYQTAFGLTQCNLFQHFRSANDHKDAFITKLSADLSSLIYSTYLGNAGANAATGLAVDSAGNAYVTGLSTSICAQPTTGFPTTPGAYQTTRGGVTSNGYATKLSADGSS